MGGGVRNDKGNGFTFSKQSSNQKADPEPWQCKSWLHPSPSVSHRWKQRLTHQQILGPTVFLFVFRIIIWTKKAPVVVGFAITQMELWVLSPQQAPGRWRRGWQRHFWTRGVHSHSLPRVHRVTPLWTSFQNTVRSAQPAALPGMDSFTSLPSACSF